MVLYLILYRYDIIQIDILDILTDMPHEPGLVFKVYSISLHQFSWAQYSFILFLKV